MKLSAAGRGGALVAALAGAVGCATTSTSSGIPAASESVVAASAGAASASDTAERSGPPIVQVRDFPSSSTVTIVAWSPDAAAYGLRTEVNRDGALVGHRLGDHRVYVSAAHAEVMGGFRQAWVKPVPPGPLLLAGGPVADRHPCNGTDWCAPMSVVNVQMPDALLRQHRDSLVVNFTAGRIRDWSIMVDREVVDGYLRAVDSVTAALKVR